MHNCRLCGSATAERFRLTVLDKYPVGFAECVNCKGLQTDAPFWLDETYKTGLPNLDTGAARRASKTCSTVLLVATLLKIPRASKILDFGGADGLTTRLLRDVGFDAFTYDKYAKNFYADGFNGRPSDSFDIVAAVEVAEHLPEPAIDLDEVFLSRPRIVVVETDMYIGQGAEWAYLGPGHGGHVFFYSPTAMQFIAKKYGYDFVTVRSTTIFSKKKLGMARKAFLAALLHPIGLLAGRIWMQCIKPDRDNELAAMKFREE